MNDLDDLKKIIYSILCILITVLVDAVLISIGLWPIAIFPTILGTIYPVVEVLAKVGIIRQKDIKNEIDKFNETLFEECHNSNENNYTIEYDKELRYEDDRKRFNILFHEDLDDKLRKYYTDDSVKDAKEYIEEKGYTLVKWRRKK